MSRAYRIQVSESVTRVVHVEDGIDTKLELLDILPPAETGAILGAELARRGFTVEDGLARRTDADGIIVEIALETGEVRIRIADQGEVKVSTQREGVAFEEVVDQARQRLSDQAKEALERQIEAEQKALQQAVTERLERKLGDVREELEQVANRVAAEALKRKAATLGEVQEVHEDEQTGNVTIRVRI
jgi:hypothetical protein